MKTNTIFSESELAFLKSGRTTSDNNAHKLIMTICEKTRKLKATLKLLGGFKTLIKQSYLGTKNHLSILNLNRDCIEYLRSAMNQQTMSEFDFKQLKEFVDSHLFKIYHPR